ncbi:hypothetical protein HYU40_05165 [Candidatus Woesearchaeota archaeon]|nr:hypothetical protein [Candidatus Woesearchaeota archaeon]
MEGGKSIDLAVTGNLQGKIVTPVGLAGLTASLTYDSLNPEVYLFVLTSSHRLKPLAGLWLGDNNPQRLSTYERNLGVRLKASFQIFPKNPNSIPGWGIFRGEAPTFSGPDVSNWTYHSRIHSLDYIERLPHVEPEMLQLHRLAGPDFSYAVRLPYDEPPAEHHLVFQTGGLSKVEIFRRSVDALCRMIDYYEGKVDKPVIGQVAATPTLPRQ